MGASGDTCEGRWTRTPITHYSYVIDGQIIDQNMNETREGYLIDIEAQERAFRQ